MDRTIKCLIGGVAIAALVAGVGYTASIKANSHVSDLVAQCQTENAQRSTSKSQDGWETAPLSPEEWLKSQSSQVCDPEILRTTSRNSPYVGIQAQIIDTQRQSERWLEQAIDIAIGIFILSAKPYAWYFFLKRVREFRDAIVGK